MVFEDQVGDEGMARFSEDSGGDVDYMFEDDETFARNLTARILLVECPPEHLLDTPRTISKVVRCFCGPIGLQPKWHIIDHMPGQLLLACGVHYTGGHSSGGDSFRLHAEFAVLDEAEDVIAEVSLRELSEWVARQSH